ncbi:hypothetical protein, partial [Pseudomonas savastanoi]|uniref:hypothetical protein n=1 Tax=Pseudomonas savastanoi TaxID=29438 RepID=UPI001CC1F8BE
PVLVFSAVRIYQGFKLQNDLYAEMLKRYEVSKDLERFGKSHENNENLINNEPVCKSDIEQKIKSTINNQRKNIKSGLRSIAFFMLLFAAYHFYVLLMSL